VSQTLHEIGSSQLTGRTEWAINCELVNLRTHSEIYAILDMLLITLTGWTPAITAIANLDLRLSPLSLSRDQFQELDDNCWYYGQTWQCPFTAAVNLSYEEVFDIDQLLVKTLREDTLDRENTLEIEDAV
jgi:hypothetical protein